MKRVMLQFVSWLMVSFSFLSIVELIFSSVCFPTTGYIVYFSSTHLTPLLLNYNSTLFFFTTGRSNSPLLILDYSFSLSADSLVLSNRFYRIGYMSPITHYIPICSMMFYTFVSSSISSLLPVLYFSFLIYTI